MQPKLEKKYKALNDSLNKLLEYTDSLSQDQLNQSPEGKWNASQILYHLKEAEQGTLAYLTNKIQAPVDEVEGGGLGSRIRAFFLSKALRSRKNKFKVPSVFKEIPDSPSYSDTRSEYLETRKKFGILLDKFDKKMMGKAYFKHPRAGKITIMQTLEFLKDHFDRHADQIVERSSLK